MIACETSPIINLPRPLMHSEEYRAMYELENRLWWYTGMRAITAVLLESSAPSPSFSRCLDVGCGTGCSLAWLRERLGSEITAGLDTSAHAADFWKLQSLDSVALASATRIPFCSDYFDLVTCFDVIYQLDSEKAELALGEMHRVLKPGGVLFIREPAYDWLRGSHDIAVGTRHRFTRGQMRRLLERRLFRILRSTYANTLLFPLFVPHRLLSKWIRGAESDVRPVPEWVNRWLLSVLSLEAHLLRKVVFPYGLSVISVAQKVTA
jgi:ubiquinone/menaquinone biosynthesis C-methylase UbiE